MEKEEEIFINQKVSLLTTPNYPTTPITTNRVATFPKTLSPNFSKKPQLNNTLNLAEDGGYGMSFPYILSLSKSKKEKIKLF